MDIADQISTNIDTFLWSLASFVCFVLILFKFALKPVVGALDAREKKIADELAQSEQALAEAKAQQEAFTAKLKDAEAEVGRLLAEARASAEQQKEALLAEGRAEAERLIGRAKREIDSAKQAALVELRQGYAEVATLAASKIVRKELDPAQQGELVQAAISELEASA